MLLNLSGFLRKRAFSGHPPRKRPHRKPAVAITGSRRYSNTPENRAKRKFLTADFVSNLLTFWQKSVKNVSNLLTSESILIQPSAVHTRSRHYYIDGHVPLWATANVLSLLIPGSSWSFGNHPGWHVGCLGRRPLSVSVAAGSPIYPSDGNYHVRPDPTPSQSQVCLKLQGNLSSGVPARRTSFFSADVE